MAILLFVYAPNASLLKKFPNLPSICPISIPKVAVSAMSTKLTFLTLQNITAVMTPAMIPPYMASPPPLIFSMALIVAPTSPCTIYWSSLNRI